MESDDLKDKLQLKDAWNVTRCAESFSFDHPTGIQFVFEFKSSSYVVKTWSEDSKCTESFDEIEAARNYIHDVIKDTFIAN